MHDCPRGKPSGRSSCTQFESSSKDPHGAMVVMAHVQFPSEPQAHLLVQEQASSSWLHPVYMWPYSQVAPAWDVSRQLENANGFDAGHSEDEEGTTFLVSFRGGGSRNTSLLPVSFLTLLSGVQDCPQGRPSGGPSTTDLSRMLKVPQGVIVARAQIHIPSFPQLQLWIGVQTSVSSVHPVYT
mmetsp:Transcript_3356/g.7249  ORF Transcript_3356/g.7249 Transcript_3356/m.7249 type:complete len:183 (-) Transcript_3356:1691-2239(-)